MSAAPLRLGIVGCGRLAELGYLPALHGIDGFRLAAVADPDPARRELVAGLSGTDPAVCADVEELVAANVDAVVVAGPVDTHVAAAAAVAAGGLPALVEKPPARDADGAVALVGLKPQPWIGFNRRFLQQAAIQSVSRRPEALEIELGISYRRSSWQPLGDLGDAWLDLGPHLADLALLLLGAEAATVAEAELEHERAVVVLEAERGSARLRCAIDAPYSEIVVVRSEGRVLASSATAGPVRALLGRIRAAEIPLVSSLREQLRAFAAAATGKESIQLASAEDGLRAMRIIDRAREAAGAQA